MDDDDEISVDHLNTSFASTATDNMDLLQQQDVNGCTTASIDNNGRDNGVTIKKHQLINQYFTKTDTDGYYCKLCNGTEDSKKVRMYALPVFISNQKEYVVTTYEFTFKDSFDLYKNRGFSLSETL